MSQAQCLAASLAGCSVPAAIEPVGPKVGVGVVVLDGARVLLIKRGKPPKMGEWSLPGGHLELGETLKAAAAREVAEETGMHVVVRDLLDVVDLIEFAADGAVSRQFALVDYWAEIAGGTLTAGDDAADARWHTIDDVAMLGLWDKTVEIIHKAARIRDESVAA